MTQCVGGETRNPEFLTRLVMKPCASLTSKARFSGAALSRCAFIRFSSWRISPVIGTLPEFAVLGHAQMNRLAVEIDVGPCDICSFGFPGA